SSSVAAVGPGAVANANRIPAPAGAPRSIRRFSFPPGPRLGASADRPPRSRLRRDVCSPTWCNGFCSWPRNGAAPSTPMTRRSSAHYLLEGLAELGIEYIFGNLGTDHVSLIEELARWDHDGRSHPQVVLCPHENVAVHMAGGYALMTGRGQAVLVHVDAGTANAAMPMHNLFRSRLPVLLMAGRAPFTLHDELRGSRDHYVHFVQDPY